MKCKKCGETIEDEYVSISAKGRLDNATDYGAGAENVKVNPAKDYYHRNCLKQRIIHNRGGQPNGSA